MLEALDLLVVVDNDSDPLSSVDKGVPQLPERFRAVPKARAFVKWFEKTIQA